MTTAADYEPELVDTLNLLIEDERASVEMEVALASGATEYAEREALMRMGIDDIRACETLSGEMERAGLPVTPQINGVVFEVLGAERYDDRLRAFAHHQRIVAERASDLLESNLDGELRAALVNIVNGHQRHIEWASQRADEFADTRTMEFGPRQRSQFADSMAAAAPSAATAESEPVSLPEIPPAEFPETEIPQVVEEAPATPTGETPVVETLTITPEAPEAAAPEAPEAPEAAEPSAEPEAAEPSASRPRRGRPRKATSSAE